MVLSIDFHGNNPNIMVIIAVRNSPSVKKYLGLLQSDTFPIINLENPYAIETPDKIVPN